MRLISYRHKGEAGVGVMVDDTGFVALNNAAPDLPRSLREILSRDGWAAWIEEAVEGKPVDLRIDDVVLEPVIPEPQAIWALALNFKMHIEETGLTTSTEHPQIFLRMPCSQVGHLQNMECLDWIFDPANHDEAARILGNNRDGVSPEAATNSVAQLTSGREGPTPKAALDMEAVRTVVDLRNRFGESRKELAGPEPYIDLSYYEAAISG